ncbi:MAG TPA: tetratricopeptide repeat protein [Humisphaera sp.]|jgi:Flp pilus assembly protein TadD|nr:tetratricopeptide repeat protein [Humisphaera sp.]
MTLNEAYELAVLHQRSGRFADAEAIYRQILAQRPNDPSCLQMAGLLAYQTGRPGDAVELLRRAIAANPSDSSNYSNMGLALIACGRFEEAVAACRQAVAMRPQTPDAHNNLGYALLKHGALDEAIAEFRQACALRPDYPEALNNLGNALGAKGHLDESMAAINQALALRPQYPAALSNLGNIMVLKGQIEQAIALFSRAIALQPNYAEAHNNLGGALEQIGRVEAAIASYRRAVELNPSYDDAKFNLSMALLLNGEFAEGWKLYEARLALVQPAEIRELKQPMWDGSNPAGKTILLTAEQGLGDTIHFVRYAALLRERGARVIVRCQEPLVRLLSGQSGIDQVIAETKPLPAFDAHCALPSLPGRFGTELRSIPGRVPYLSADASEVERWRLRLTRMQTESGDASSPSPGTPGEGWGGGCVEGAPLANPLPNPPPEYRGREQEESRDGGTRLNVGLAWAGNPKKRLDDQRSIPLATLAPLASVAGTEFISLQKGAAAAQARNAPTGLRLIDLTDDLHDFADTAALICNLDLVITVDTAVAHLAGALGKPVWVLLPFANDWRWLRGRSDSPWYPTMRLFRQPTPGNWATPISQIVEELKRLADRSPAQP